MRVPSRASRLDGDKQQKAVSSLKPTAAYTTLIPTPSVYRAHEKCPIAQRDLHTSTLIFEMYKTLTIPLTWLNGPPKTHEARAVLRTYYLEALDGIRMS